MQTLLKALFWISLAVSFFWCLTTAFNVNPPDTQDLYDLRAGYEESREQFHRQQLIDQMCEISFKMRFQNVPSDIKEFLKGRCV